MTDLEAIEIIYNLAVRSMKEPCERDLDAIFQVRALIASKNRIRDEGGAIWQGGPIVDGQVRDAKEWR